MQFYTPIRFINNHPLTQRRKFLYLSKFFLWQLRNLFVKTRIKSKWIHGAALIIKKGMHGATGNYYAPLHDFMEMSFLLHLLQSADTFWDLGANIGSYTILAGKISNAHVLSVEPLPRTFHYLKKNIHINSIEDKVISLNIGLSDKPGELFFTQHHDTVNHVTNPNNSNALRVSVETCNNLLANSLHCPVLMKIDVEGFEFPVLKGADQVLNNPILKAIILELNGLGAKYGYKDEEIDQFLRKFGFQPYIYHPFQRKLEQIDWPIKSANILYLRDMDFVRERIKNGMEIHAGGYIY